VPTETRPDTDPQRYLLSTVRQSRAAVIDAIRTWTTVTEQLTRTLRVPVPDVDLSGPWTACSTSPSRPSPSSASSR
jgi:hypothetical protein